jgi:hypothetical protein
MEECIRYGTSLPAYYFIKEDDLNISYRSDNPQINFSLKIINGQGKGTLHEICQRY